MKQQQHVQENNSKDIFSTGLVKTVKACFAKLVRERCYKKISIAATFVVVAMLILSCENNKLEQIKELTSSEKMPSMEADNFESIYSDSTIVVSRMTAPKLIRFELDEKEPFTEFPKGIKMEKFGPDMQVVSIITADFAIYRDKEKKWTAQNNVVAVNEKGDSLLTEELIWDEAKGRIFSDKFVKIIQQDQIITGFGFESDQNMTNWEIKKVKGTLYMSVEE